MKGQINLEFLASALIFLLTLGILITLGSDILPNFSGSVETSSTYLQAYTISTMVLSNPGETSTGKTEWDATNSDLNDISFFGLSKSSEDFLNLDESKIRNITTYEFTTSEPYVNYTEFKNLTGAQNQYFFNFTWQPMAYAGNTLYPPYSSKDLEQDLILYHEFEKGSSAGNNVPDSSDSNNHGTNYGGERLSNGTFKTNAFRFSRSDKDRTTFPDLEVTNTSLSVAFWFKKEGSWQPEEHMFFIGTDNEDRELRVGKHPSQGFMWSYYDGSSFNGVTGLTPPSPDEWTHLTATFNQQTDRWKLYLDGELEAETVVDQDLFIPEQENNGVAQGGENGEFSFNGSIDEFRVYERVLQEEDVQKLMNRRSKIETPANSGFRNSNSRSYFDTKRLDGERFFYLISRESGEGTFYISDNWNFNNSNTLRVGDEATIAGRELDVADIEITEHSGYTMFKQNINSFGPSRDSDSTVVRLERFGMMKGEPMKVEVLAW